MKTEMKKLYLFIMALLVSLPVWAVPNELYLYNTNPTQLGTFQKNGDVFTLKNVSVASNTYVLISENESSAWDGNGSINEKRWGADSPNLAVSAGNKYSIKDGWHDCWILPAGTWTVIADFTDSNNPQLSITTDWYFKLNGGDWQPMKMNVDGTFYMVRGSVTNSDNFFIADNNSGNNAYGQAGYGMNLKIGEDYAPKQNVDYGIYFDSTVHGNDVVVSWNPYTKKMSAKEVEAVDYYFCGDLNQWQLASTDKHYRMDGTEMTTEDFKAAWRFVPCENGDRYSEGSGWYKLVVPALGDGSHNHLCGQFKINDGSWNDGGSYGHEWTVNFNHDESTIALSNLKRMYDYISNADDPITSAYKNEPYKRLQDLGLTVKNKAGEEYTEDEITDADTEIFESYLTLTKNIVSADASATVSLANVCNSTAGSYAANINLPCNTVEPAGNNDHVVIYFNPGSIYSTDAVNTDAKIAIQGDARDLYLYYCTDEPDNIENVVGVVRTSKEGAAALNYHVDRLPNMGNFEKVTTETLRAPNGVEYTTFWRKKIANGYEHRMTGYTQPHEYFTVNFWRKKNTDGAVAERIASDVIICDDVYAIEGKTYDVQVSVRGSEQEVTGVGMYLCRTNESGTRLFDATSFSEDKELSEMTPVEMTRPADANGWWTLPEDKQVLSQYGNSYLVFKVTFADGTYKLYNYADDGSLQAKWYKMDNKDKQVIINLGSDDLGIGGLYFSALSGDCAAGESLEVNVELLKDGKPYRELPADATARGIEYAYGVSADANVNNVAWETENSNVPYHTFGNLEAGDHYIFVRARYTTEGAVEHIACAPFTVASSTVAEPRLKVTGIRYVAYNEECDGCKVEQISVGQQMKKPQHLHVTVEGSLLGTATVEWVKFDNGIKQEYNVTDKNNVTTTVDANAIEKSYAEAGDFAHTTFNFGQCLYRAIVTVPATEPASAPRRAVLNRITADNIELVTPTNAIAYSYETEDNKTSVDNVSRDADDAVEPIYYNLQGMPVASPAAGNIYIEVRGTTARTIRY